MEKDMDLGDLTLPEDNTKADSKSAFDEKREMSEYEKKNLEKQKQFEYEEVEGRELRKEEEKKESKMEILLKFIVGAAVFLLLLGLYFWLIR
jgi:hypothetical protein